MNDLKGTTLKLQRVCVFCGSSMGAQPIYRRSAQELGRELVSRNIDLVYGGGGVGLMGILADTVLELGGKVLGVLPEALMAREVGHVSLTELRIVSSMHERKAQMSALADAFIALPGGYGTFEELFEVITWAQLGLHSKPIGVLNAGQYFDRLLQFLDHAVEEGFIPSSNRKLLLASERPEDLLQSLLTSHHQPDLNKGID